MAAWFEVHAGLSSAAPDASEEVSQTASGIEELDVVVSGSFPKGFVLAGSRESHENLH